MENVNNSIEKTASNDKSKKEIETNEKKYNSDTGQPQARKFKNILKGVIGWGGITVAVLAVILWILHNWLGYLIVSVENKWDFADSQCQWLNKNLSLWLVGKGMLRVPEDGYWYLDKYHFKKDTLNFRIKYFNHSNNTIRTNAFRSFRYMMKGYREIR